MARTDVYLNINASDPADAVVLAQQTLTATDFPTLVLGDTPSFNFYFTDGTASWPSFAGDGSYSVTWALSDSIANDNPPYALQTASTPLTGGWAIRLPLNTGTLINACAARRVSQSWPVVQLWQHIRVTDPSGYVVSYALVRTNVRLRAISDTQQTPDDPLPAGEQFVLANEANALSSPTNLTFAGNLANRLITNGAALDSWGAISRASGFDAFTATPSGANLASLLTSSLPGTSVSTASTSARGTVEFATPAEAAGGTSSSVASTPASIAVRQRLDRAFFAERTYHASPPAKAALNSSSTISSAASISKTNAALRVLRGSMSVAGGSYPDDQFVRPDYITTNNESSPIGIQFGFDGTEIEVYVKDTSGKFRLLVDGQIASTVTSLGSTGNLYFQKFTFPTRRQRVLTIEGCSAFYFGGLKIGPNDSVYLPPAAPQQRVIFVGDSYTEGTGANTQFQAWSHIAADALGWDGWSSGSGSTGWATAGTNIAKFADRLSADVIANTPDAVIFAGGINDETYYGSNGSAAYTAQVEACLDALLVGLPSLDEIVIVGPWWPSSAASTNRDGVRAVLQQAATDYGAIWIDPKGWITGTGRVGTTTGTGNADLYTSSDAVHPSNAGHAYIARRFVEDYLRQRGVTTDSSPTFQMASALWEITTSASVNFGSMAAGADDTQTVTVDGASTTYTPTVELGWSASLEAGIVVAQAWVSAANTVSIRVNNTTAGVIDPAAVTVRVRVRQERT